MSYNFMFAGYTETRKVTYLKDAEGKFVDAKVSDHEATLNFISPIGTTIALKCSLDTLSEVLDSIGKLVDHSLPTP